jgi:2-polyprenyl-3-methyl-5-hydroxy-6-metoxy-1,4-benzoquinol methylase
MQLAEAERAKYERVWQIPSYGNFSPGERLVDAFLEIVEPDRRAWITDFGTGSGKAARKLQKLGYKVRTVDHTKDGISPARWRYLKGEFQQACLWNMPRVVYSKYGYCVDVMEHIPVEATMLTIHEIMAHCHECFFQICTLPDHFGESIGEPLHLTVMPFTWWRDRLAELTTVLDARDLMHAGLFHVRN